MRRNWLYAIGFSFILFTLLALVGVFVLVPWYVQRGKMRDLMNAPLDKAAITDMPVPQRPLAMLARRPDSAFAKAVNWWADRIARDDKARIVLEREWAASTDEPEQFMRIGLAFDQAGLTDRQQIELRLLYYRRGWLDKTLSVDQRTLGTQGLTRFPGDSGYSLEVAVRQALADPALPVALEAVQVLPTWDDREWAQNLLAELLSDKRIEVRRKAALAAGVFDAIPPRLSEAIYGLLDFGGDDQTRANASWAAWCAASRGVWYRARSPLWQDRVRSEEPPGPQAARVWPLLFHPFARKSVGGDIGDDYLQPGARLIGIALQATDPLVRERAAMVLCMLTRRSASIPAGHRTTQPELGGAVPTFDFAPVIDRLLGSQRWQGVAIACRLIGLGGRADYLGKLEELVTRDDRPEAVTEQLAFALGSLIADETLDNPTHRRAQAALSAVTNRSLIRATTQPDAAPDTQPEESGVSMLTRLNAARGWAIAGNLEPLLALTRQLMEAAPDTPQTPDLLADMACLELYRLADGRPGRREALVAIGREMLFHSFQDRPQRSGALLLGLLDDRGPTDAIYRLWEGKRQQSDPVTGVYLQAALALLGDRRADKPVPLAAWLSEPRARTPGVYAALLLSGDRLGGDKLLLPGSDQGALAGAIVLLDNWGLREVLADHVAGLAAPIPAADAELVDLTRRTSSWWWQTHASRLTFTPAGRRWAMPQVAAER
ncbi:MAG: hypothetical protein BIFFINMI_00772 [Phycisphaerae bacterium]|nr:hypothetical protein [Phycisphaerae bacterium]